MKAILCSLVLLVGTSALAAEERFPFEDPARRALFMELTQELRCPKCQNQNIADSNALVAEDLKRKVYQLVQDGYSKAEVVDYMKQRYGDFVHYQPPLNLVTVMLWLLPLLAVLVGGWMVFRRRASSKASDGLLAEAEKWLEKDK